MTTFFFGIFLHIIVLQTCLCIGNSVLMDAASRINTRQTGYRHDKLPASNSAELILSDHQRRKREDVKENNKLYKNGSFSTSEFPLVKSFHPGSAVSDRRTFWKQPINASLAGDRHRISKLFQALHTKLKKSILLDGLRSKPHLFQDTHAKYRKSVGQVISPLKLFIVAALLARHKYTGYDPRQNDGVGPKNFHRHFPVPPLVALHPIVRKACEEGFDTCIQEISEFIEPHLESNIERFEFLTTASYYMCWYTMRRVRDLLLLDNVSRELFQCLDLNALRNYRYRFKDPRIELTRPSGSSVEDVRLSDFKRPYLCAELSFCPDYCYGRNTQGIVKDIRRDNGNPCFGLPDSWCSVYPEKNGDFSHLMRNDFNYSCRCEGVHVGFTWNKKLGLCVDVDECEEGLHNCAENMICQNTVGSFQCFCTWGYHWTGQSCTEVTQLLKRSDVDTAVPFGNTGTQHKGKCI